MSLLRYVIFLFLYVSNYYWYRHRLEVYNSWSTSIVRKDVLVLDKPFHKIAPLKKNSQGRFCETICCKLSFFFGEKTSAQLDQLRAHPDVFCRWTMWWASLERSKALLMELLKQARFFSCWEVGGWQLQVESQVVRPECGGCSDRSKGTLVFF